MVKFYEDYVGSGMYVYFLIFDKDGNNIFVNDIFEGILELLNVIVGCLKGIFDLVLIFVLYGNSYDCLVFESYVLIGICWVYENCMVLICVLGGSFVVWCIEYCVVGGDVNFYLFLVVVLGFVLVGLENQIILFCFISGNVYDQDLL